MNKCEKKFIIINQATNQILCKNNSNRRYRQHLNSIVSGLKVVVLSKEKAQVEANYLNKEYYEGWEIQEVRENE